MESEKSEKSYENIVLNDTPKCRNASPTGTLLNDTPKCRSGCPEWL
ncbi:MAG: hypothetical protein WC721_20035 [Victivallaceae bacterium]